MSSVSLLDRVQTGNSSNPKLICALALSLVFLCGAAVGALVMDLGVHNKVKPKSFDTASGKALYFERLQKELDLTPAQSEQIQVLLSDFWVYYRNVLTDSKQKIELILNDEQRKKFEKILQQQQPPPAK